MKTRTLPILLAAMAVLPCFYLWKFTRNPGLTGSWNWSDSSIFEFQKIGFRFSRDSFFLAQRFINPRNLPYLMPCAQTDHFIYAAGPYYLTGDSLRFAGNFTDSRFSRDTIRLCRDTGFRGVSHFSLAGDTLWLSGAVGGKKVRLVRARKVSEVP